MLPRPPRPTLFPYTTLFRSPPLQHDAAGLQDVAAVGQVEGGGHVLLDEEHREPDRKSTRLNSSHVEISYAVFCLKKKTHTTIRTPQRAKKSTKMRDPPASHL